MEFLSEVEIREIFEQIGLDYNKSVKYELIRVGVESGTISTILRLRFVANPSNSYIIKIPNPKSPMFELLKAKNALISLSEQLHQSEYNFYKMTRLVDNFPSPIPHMFVNSRILGSELTPKAIVMDDLTQTSVSVNLLEGLSLNHVRELIVSLAKLHVFSWSTSEWKKLISTPIGLAGLPDLLEFSLSQLDEKYLQKLSPQGLQVIRESLLAYDRDSSYQLTFPSVIVHGDLWINNILMDKSQPDRLKSIIDWQFVHQGCFTEDLARLFISGCNQEMLSAHLDSLIQLYFNTLAEEAKAHRIALPKREDFDNLYSISSIGALFASITELPESIAKAESEDNSQVKIDNVVSRVVYGLERIRQLK